MDIAALPKPSVAVVIPVGSPFDQIEKCLDHCVAQSYPNRTFAVVTDVPMDVTKWPGVVNLVTGASGTTGPAQKRDFARRNLPEHDIYAYLDADAYPAQEWLANAVSTLAAHPETCGVGGPGIMPPDQTFPEALSAACTESILGGGPLRYRFWPTKPLLCDDYPAYNLFIRREDLDAAGGWASDFYSGEDTLLCAKLADSGRPIFYDPTVVIYHYRRAIVPGHWKQNFNVGRSRGTFIREGAKRSFALTFFAPLAGIVALLALLLAMAAIPSLRIPGLLVLAVSYVLAVVVGHPGPLRPAVRLVLPIGLFLHHLAYAYGFVLGLLFKGRRRVTAVLNGNGAA